MPERLEPAQFPATDHFQGLSQLENELIRSKGPQTRKDLARDLNSARLSSLINTAAHFEPYLERYVLGSFSDHFLGTCIGQTGDQSWFNTPHGIFVAKMGRREEEVEATWFENEIEAISTPDLKSVLAFMNEEISKNKKERVIVPPGFIVVEYQETDRQTGCLTTTNDVFFAGSLMRAVEEIKREFGSRDWKGIKGLRVYTSQGWQDLSLYDEEGEPYHWKNTKSGRSPVIISLTTPERLGQSLALQEPVYQLFAGESDLDNEDAQESFKRYKFNYTNRGQTPRIPKDPGFTLTLVRDSKAGLDLALGTRQINQLLHEEMWIRHAFSVRAA